jgi:hypothetical protein
MKNLAVKIAVLESEKIWGAKIDDWMVCLTIEDALKFKEEFNSKNTSNSVPDWYMIAIDEPIPIELNNDQFEWLQIEKRTWLSSLNQL